MANDKQNLQISERSILMYLLMVGKFLLLLLLLLLKDDAFWRIEPNTIHQSAGRVPGCSISV